MVTRYNRPFVLAEGRFSVLQEKEGSNRFLPIIAGYKPGAGT
ncbi:hypothetical protein B4099_2637 [Heyndrickxia coagulans]|uniref:Uncharacterized protein n=1 Tax=Heyndrickxia coagulans TaxID=1398 RepID=A0A150JPJ9_HEYCO|nr:hypothetical protein B4099_2637 [Heyndrickxia coagulans]